MIIFLCKTNSQALDIQNKVSESLSWEESLKNHFVPGADNTSMFNHLLDPKIKLPVVGQRLKLSDYSHISNAWH